MVIRGNYRVIHKSLRNFLTQMRNNQDRRSRKDISITCMVGQKLGVSLPLSINLCYWIFHFTFLPPSTHSSYYTCTFLPHFNSLYLYIMLLLCHSMCFILHKVFYTLILLSVIYFSYTAYSICISINSDGSKKLPMMADYFRNT
jgi:hypothetical protein